MYYDKPNYYFWGVRKVTVGMFYTLKNERNRKFKNNFKDFINLKKSKIISGVRKVTSGLLQG